MVSFQLACLAVIGMGIVVTMALMLRTISSIDRNVREVRLIAERIICRSGASSDGDNGLSRLIDLVQKSPGPVDLHLVYTRTPDTGIGSDGSVR